MVQGASGPAHPVRRLQVQPCCFHVWAVHTCHFATRSFPVLLDFLVSWKQTYQPLLLLGLYINDCHPSRSSAARMGPKGCEACCILQDPPAPMQPRHKAQSSLKCSHRSLDSAVQNHAVQLLDLLATCLSQQRQSGHRPCLCGAGSNKS